MLKKISVALAAVMLMTPVANAARSDQLSELNALIDECADKGYNTDYEKSATAVFEHFASLEETDLADTSLSSSQKSYYSGGMDKIYNETKANLNAYLAGTKSPFAAIDYPANATRKISGNIFTDGEGNPLLSTGFGHGQAVFDDADMLKTMGSSNIQTEIGPSFFAQPTPVPRWKVLCNSGCDADISVVEEEDGNKCMKIVNRVNEAETPNTYVLISQYIHVEPNTSYRISMNMRSDDNAQVYVYPNGWFNGSTPFGTTNEWSKKSLTMYKTGDENYINLFILTKSVSTVYIDDVSVVKNKSKVNLAKNPDFESDGEYYFEFDLLKSKLDAIDSAAKKGHSVDLLLSPHYMPQFMLTKYPEMKLTSTGIFFGYNINHPTAKQFISDYLEFVIPFVADCDGVQSICISNEPNFYTGREKAFYEPIFREWLKEKYGTIANLNATYGASYGDFSNISMPSSDLYRTPIGYDYLLFNEDQFASWHKMMADIIKKYTDKPIHAKMQDYLFFYDGYSQYKLLAGTDAELFAEFCDIAGNDATAYISQSGSMSGTMMWYDFLSSVTDKPVYNSEDHIITDENTNFSYEQGEHTRHDLLTGAIHGRSASSIWHWDYKGTSWPEGLFMQQPYTTYMTGKTMLDMQRLKNEISAFVTAEKDTAFYYSKATRLMTSDTLSYENALTKAYNAVTALGHKTGFVTERHPEKVNNYKTLILTSVTCLPESSAEAIAEFMKNGGNVIADSASALDKNEYGIAKTSDARAYIKNNATYVSSQSAAAYYNVYSAFGDVPVTVKNSSGSVAEDIDVKVADYKGNDLIYIASTDAVAKTVTLPGDWVDLISGAEVTNAISLGKYEPVLLISADALSATVTGTLTGVFGEKESSFAAKYKSEKEKNATVSIIAYDADGIKLGFAFSKETLRANEEKTFAGNLMYDNAAVFKLVVADNGTGKILYTAEFAKTTSTENRN